MHGNIENLKLQYKGYAQTSLLWKDDAILGLRQLKIPPNTDPILEPIFEKMRLGFRVERFIAADLRQMENIEILAENVQVNDQKQTIGELDCLLLENGKPIHLEIIFKLYLFDETVGSTEIDHWIGGNRRDSLSRKLMKLKEKQLPLLYNPKTKTILDDLDLKAENIEQRVHFKAQLFVPYQTEVTFTLLNKECLKGFYIWPDELQKFSKSLFYIPIKTDWLIEPQADVEWMDFKNFKEKIDAIIISKSYPLCWICYPDGGMQKFFVVWWD